MNKNRNYDNAEQQFNMQPATPYQQHQIELEEIERKADDIKMQYHARKLSHKSERNNSH